MRSRLLASDGDECRSSPSASSISRSASERREDPLPARPRAVRPTMMCAHPVRAGEVESAGTGSRACKPDHLRAQLARLLDVGEQVRCASASMRQGPPRGLDVDHEPVGVEAPGHARAAAQERQAVRRVGGHGRPSPARPMGAARTGAAAPWRRRCARGSRPPRAGPARAASRGCRAEEVLERPGDFVGRVDLARAQPLEQILDGRGRGSRSDRPARGSVSGTVSRTITPVSRSTQPVQAISRCWMLSAPITLMPCSRRSSTSW